MSVWEILAELWELPWYKTMFIAFIDNIFTFVKLWPFWLFLIVVMIILFITTRNKK